mmetsp:Transcript_23808/g.59565  ORF Transcript_23808/g.59565 Transcript_23808/m.59565 type:complete len:379 (+) Transcript_23808:506-1642(+)
MSDMPNIPADHTEQAGSAVRMSSSIPALGMKTGKSVESTPTDSSSRPRVAKETKCPPCPLDSSLENAGSPRRPGSLIISPVRMIAPKDAAPLPPGVRFVQSASPPAPRGEEQGTDERGGKHAGDGVCTKDSLEEVKEMRRSQSPPKDAAKEKKFTRSVETKNSKSSKDLKDSGSGEVDAPTDGRPKNNKHRKAAKSEGSESAGNSTKTKHRRTDPGEDDKGKQTDDKGNKQKRLHRSHSRRHVDSEARVAIEGAKKERRKRHSQPPENTLPKTDSRHRRNTEGRQMQKKVSDGGTSGGRKARKEREGEERRRSGRREDKAHAKGQEKKKEKAEEDGGDARTLDMAAQPATLRGKTDVGKAVKSANSRKKALEVKSENC